jgi:hypothetical protein
MQYSPDMLSSWGKEYAMQAQGIYYREHFSEDLVVSNRKIWIPTLPESDEETPEILERLSRAQIFALHAKDNETWCKSEYAWEADAWSDVFGSMREDHCLAMYVPLPISTGSSLADLYKRQAQIFESGC